MYFQISKILEERKSQLLINLSALASSKQQVLDNQKSSLEDFLDRINNSCDFTVESLKQGSETEVLVVKKEMSQKLEELVNCERPQSLPEQNDFLYFSESSLDALKTSIDCVGEVSTNNSVAYQTVASGEGLKHCQLGRPSIITVTTKDCKGDLVRTGHGEVTARMSRDTRSSSASSRGGERSPSVSMESSEVSEPQQPTVTDNGNGTYDVTYVLRNEGRYRLEIFLFGQHIKASPFRVRFSF